jgi:hypothetical protein
MSKARSAVADWAALISSVKKFTQKTDQPNSNRQDADSDAQYGHCRVGACDNPDDAGPDDAKRNEIRQYGVDHGVTPATLLSVALGAPPCSSRPQATLPMWPSLWRSVIVAGPKLILFPAGYDVASSADRARPPTPAEPERVAPASASRSGPDPRVRCTRTALATAPFLIFPRLRADFLLPLHRRRRRRRRPVLQARTRFRRCQAASPGISDHIRNTGSTLASPRCGARTRTDDACRSPAVRGKKRCRVHGGAAGSGAPKANQNARKHGLFTGDAIAERRQIQALLGEARKPLEEMK